MTIAIASIQRNRNPYIIEWLAFHLAVGFDQFYIYAHKTTDGMTETLLRLSQKYPIQVFSLEADDWPQIIAYNHAWSNFGTKEDWIAFIDGDEFLFPTQNDSMAEALNSYKDTKLSALGVYWKCYGSNGHITEPEGLLLENYLRHSDNTFYANSHIKSIVKGSEQVFPNRSHLFETGNGTVDEHFRPITAGLMADYQPTYDIFRINHYPTQSLEYFKRTKQNIGAADLPAGTQRSDEWFIQYDRNEEQDGMALNFLQKTKDYMNAMLAFLREGTDDRVEKITPSADGKVHFLAAEATEERTTPAPVTADQIRLFTIGYSEETNAQAIGGTERLDNLANERPDWREYWAIRRYLLENELQEHAYYGFFSPKFVEKTGLDGNGVRKFLLETGTPADVFTFSPQADMGAFFLNTFEQAEAFDPGFMASTRQLAAELSIGADIGSLVMDARQVVFSNYFVANKKFWNRWLEIGERIFSICEKNTSALAQDLNRGTTYPGAVPRKVFLIERIASLMLTTESWTSAPYSTFNCAWSALPTSRFHDEAITSDALKLAFNVTRDNNYIQAFSRLREKIFSPEKNLPETHQ